MKVHYNGIELSVFEMDELPRIVAVLMFFVDAVDDALTLCFIDAQDFFRHCAKKSRDRPNPRMKKKKKLIAMMNSC